MIASRKKCWPSTPSTTQLCLSLHLHDYEHFESLELQEACLNYSAIHWFSSRMTIAFTFFIIVEAMSNIRHLEHLTVFRSKIASRTRLLRPNRSDYTLEYI